MMKNIIELGGDMTLDAAREGKGKKRKSSKQRRRGEQGKLKKNKEQSKKESSTSMRKRKREENGKRVADANLRWKQLPYIRVSEPVLEGDGGPDGRQRRSRRRQRVGLGCVRVHFAEPTPVTQVFYFDISPNENSRTLSARSDYLIGDCIYDSEKENSRPVTEVSEDTDSDNSENE